MKKFVKSLFVFKIILPAVILMVLASLFLSTAIHIEQNGFGFLTIRMTAPPQLSQEVISPIPGGDDPLFGWPLTILSRYGGYPFKTTLVVSPIGLILNLFIFMIIVRAVLPPKKSRNL